MADREDIDLWFGAPDVEGSEHPDADRFEVCGGGGRNNVIPLTSGAENVTEERNVATTTSLPSTSPPAANRGEDAF